MLLLKTLAGSILVVVSVGWAEIGTTASRPEALLPPSLDYSYHGAGLFDECETGCNPVGDGENTDHYTFWNLNGEYSGTTPESHPERHFKTLDGDCSSAHNVCDGGNEEDFEQLRLAVARGDDGAAVVLMRVLGDAAIINESRRVIQLMTCKGLVAVNLPLSRSMLHALAVQIP